MPPEESMIPVARPWLGDAEVQAAARPLLSGWVTQGPETAAFEVEFAAHVGANYACAVSSCTTALHLALLAAGVRAGDEVVTVSHSFIATANSIRACGARPVFVDIEPATFNLDPRLLEAAIGPRTRAVLCVHQLGRPCDLRAVLEVARRRGLPVIEDAACAVGGEILWDGAWEKVGRPHGDVACFSFHPRKVITTGDGGMLTTSNAEWDRQFRLWRQHGMSVPDSVRHEAREVVFESYLTPGYNYRLTDIQAAVGREQLRRLPEIVARRRHLADRYRSMLAGVHGLILPEESSWARANWQSFCVRLPDGCDQRRVMKALLDRRIATRRGVMCAHREPAYGPGTWSCRPGDAGCACPAAKCSRLQHSEEAQDRTIILPLFAQMTEAEQLRVAAALRDACRAAGTDVPEAPAKGLPALALQAHMPAVVGAAGRPLLCVVTPAFNEAKNLPLLYDRLREVLAASDVDWEWVVVDDHSSDGTYGAVQDIARRDPRVRAVRLARNFGSHTAISCGLHHARGDGAVVMAADMQDPPEALPGLVARWRRAAHVVWAARAGREGETASTIGFSRLYYLIMRRLVGLKEMPADGADFFLIDRRVIDAFRQFNETNVSIFALLTWMGFRQETVAYTKQARRHGRSGWTLAKKIKLLLDSVASFSYFPIRLMTGLGSAVAVLGLLYSGLVLINGLAGRPPQGWTSLMATVLVLGGGQMLMLGVLGEYIWRALDESRRRPRYLIEENTDPAASAAADLPRKSAA